MPMSTAGLAAGLTGEDWHYVGESGEPAFENDWENSPTQPALAFRVREAGIVDVQGSIINLVDPTDTVFTLPAGYRPSSQTFIIAAGVVGATTTVPFVVSIGTDGVLVPQGANPSVVAVIIVGQFFLDPPVAA